MCVDEFPNMFMALGPNSIIGAGLLMPILEFSVGYAVQAAAKMQRERIKSMEVKRSAVRDFDRYMEVRVAIPFDSTSADGEGWAGQSYFPQVRARVSVCTKELRD